MAYALDGIPNDLLNTAKIGTRRLKVEAVILDPSETPEAGLIQKDFTYHLDGRIDTKTETNLTTSVITEFTFNYDLDLKLINITPTLL